MQAPSLPKGTRDFAPDVMARRNYIFGILKDVFALYGYPQLETPAMENIETLTGKYGDEGDKLIFGVLDSGEIDNLIPLSTSTPIIDDGDQFANFNQITKLNQSEANSDHDLFTLSASVDKICKDIICQVIWDLNQKNNLTFDNDITEFKDISNRKVWSELSISNLNFSDRNDLVSKFWVWDGWNGLIQDRRKYSDQIRKYEHIIWFLEGILRNYQKSLNKFKLDFIKSRPRYKRIQAQLKRSITEKALRYDLTVPFARFVVMNQGHLTFPFKRSQIQPVWRADRPQKGRYREFYQCDVDVVGSNSLMYEVEMTQVLDTALTRLGIPSVIKINNRKILAGIADACGAGDRMMEFTIILDKLDKVGADGVTKEMSEKGFSESAITSLRPLFTMSGTNEEKLSVVSTIIGTNATGKKGLEELQYVLDRTVGHTASATIEFDVTLARGLNYYTGAIFEVKATGVQMGSICGGGRYDDLTGIFGLPGVSGIGVSFGADRIYDVMTELNLFPAQTGSQVQVLLANFGEAEMDRCVEVARTLRQHGISCEVYPDSSKLKKQFKYADDKGIPYVGAIGSQELADGTVSLKNMQRGEQQTLTVEQLIAALKS